MSDKKNQQNSLGESLPGESFKDQVLRALQEGNNNPSTTPKTSINQTNNEEPPTPPRVEKQEAPKTPQAPATPIENTRATRSKSKRERGVVEELPQRRKNPKKQPPQRKPDYEDDVLEQKANRVVRHVILIVAVTLLLVIGIAGFTFYGFVDKSLQPYDVEDKHYEQVNIPIGSSNKQIGGILQQAKVIRSGMVFNYYTKFHNLANFKGGYYNFQPSMTIEEITNLLSKGGTEKPEYPSLGKITIPEGYTIEQISKAFEINANSKEDAKTPYTAKEFLDVVNDETFFNEMKEKYPELLTSAASAKGVKYRLEGYLFPATYDYNEKSSVKSLVEEMIATMDQTLQDKYAMMKAKGLSVQKTLALASYVEKEGATKSDRKNIAQVFFNRIEADMPLQTNISILYAEGKVGQKISAEEDKNIDTNINSPYNLYKNTGTGPGPVDSPSLMSIEAVLEPKPNDYYFFIADTKTGKVYFSKTLEEHNALVSEHIN